MNLEEKFDILYTFFVGEFSENIYYLSSILAETNKDDDCIQLMINTELYITEWLRLFFGDHAEDVYQAWMDSCIWGDGINSRYGEDKAKVMMKYYRQPSEREVIDTYNKTSKIEFPFLNWEYVDKKIYRLTDEMVDNLFPDLDY